MRAFVCVCLSSAAVCLIVRVVCLRLPARACSCCHHASLSRAAAWRCVRVRALAYVFVCVASVALCLRLLVYACGCLMLRAIACVALAGCSLLLVVACGCVRLVALACSVGACSVYCCVFMLGVACVCLRVASVVMLAVRVRVLAVAGWCVMLRGRRVRLLVFASLWLRYVHCCVYVRAFAWCCSALPATCKLVACVLFRAVFVFAVACCSLWLIACVAVARVCCFVFTVVG